MLTPQEVADHAFAKSAFGGYNMTMVDEFLDELTDDYTALYKENAALKAKMKVLVDKVEEYRATEDAMRRALLTAQNMASAMVSEAEEKKAALLASAEQEANEKLGALHDEIVVEQKRLNQIKAQTKEFADSARTLCERQLRALELLPDMTPEPVEQTTAEAREQHEEAASFDALSKKLTGGDEAPAQTEAAPADTAATIQFPAVKAADAPKESAKPRVRLADLKFGRNYKGEEDQ